MRAVIVSSEFPPGPGGIGTHAFELARGLHALGWSVSVATSQDYASPDEVGAFNRAQAFAVHPFRPMSLAPLEAVFRGFQVGSLIRREKPDVLIASGSRSVMLAAALPSGSHVPSIAIGHGSEFGLRGSWQSVAIRAAFERASAVVCVSDFTRRQMTAAGIHARRVRVIPNGADPARFRKLPRTEAEALRNELGLANARIVVTVGNLTERKGQDIVVRALPAVLERFPDTHYVMAGLPTRGEELRQLAQELGVADRVHILGRVGDDRLIRLLNAADVFVMTSRTTAGGDFEGYGIAAVEAALCGCPAVVSLESGLAEAVSAGRTGLCVAPDDPAETARAIGMLLEDEDRRRSMGEAARARAQNEQTWAGRIRAYDSLARELAGVGPDVVASLSKAL